MTSLGAHGLTCRRSLLLQEESDVELTCRRSSACFFIKLCYLYKKHTANQSKCGNPKNLKAKEKERRKVYPSWCAVQGKKREVFSS
jgi:acyl-CoA-binding protein